MVTHRIRTPQVVALLLVAVMAVAATLVLLSPPQVVTTPEPTTTEARLTVDGMDNRRHDFTSGFLWGLGLAVLFLWRPSEQKRRFAAER